MRDLVEIDPDPTPVEFEVVLTALSEAQLLDPPSTHFGHAWRLVGLVESVDRAPQAPSPRRSRGATRA